MKNSKERSTGLLIFLCIITFGIYAFFWIASVEYEYAKLQNVESKRVKVIFLTIITFGIYILFWSYKIGKSVEETNNKDQSILYLLTVLVTMGGRSFTMPTQLSLTIEEIFTAMTMETFATTFYNMPIIIVAIIASAISIFSMMSVAMIGLVALGFMQEELNDIYRKKELSSEIETEGIEKENINEFKNRNIIKCVIYTILTFGIYGLYWISKLESEFAKENNREKKGTYLVVYALLTLGTYKTVWLYKIGKDLEKIGRVDNTYFYAIIDMLSFGLISMILLQLEVNNISSSKIT